jgi:hypothetical protein
MNAQNITAARELLNNFPLLAATAAISQIAAMLALDWQTAESLYNTIEGGVL